MIIINDLVCSRATNTIVSYKLYCLFRPSIMLFAQSWRYRVLSVGFLIWPLSVYKKQCRTLWVTLTGVPTVHTVSTIYVRTPAVGLSEKRIHLETVTFSWILRMSTHTHTHTQTRLFYWIKIVSDTLCSVLRVHKSEKNFGRAFYRALNNITASYKCVEVKKLSPIPRFSPAFVEFTQAESYGSSCPRFY